MSWKNERPLSTAELLAILEEDEDLFQTDSVDAVYIPPPVDEVTDEEELDDDLRENVINLPDVAGTYEIHASLPNSSEDLDSELLPSSSIKSKVSKKNINKSKTALPKWKKEVPVYTTAPQNKEKINLEDIENRIGDEDKGIPLVRNSMSRNRFDSIKQNLHLSDNDQLDKNDRFSKLRPLFDLINEKNMQFGVFSHNLSIDEEMVPYFGRHSCKMFIKGKPIRFGFKLWCLCSSNGYLYKCIPYGGKTSTYNNELGLGANVVLELLSVVQHPSLHRVFFDNFFSSYKLFCLLKERGFYATGTIRENRTCNNTIETVKNLKKKDRGTYDFSFENNQKILLVRWNDNSVVTVVTNNSTIEPLVGAKRYNRKEKKAVSISQPKVIAEYNQHMGGVDLHDNGICNYRINVKGKKWWWPLFVNLIDSVIVNAWKVHNLANKSKMSQLDFKSYIAVALMKMNEPAPENNIQDQDTSGPSNQINLSFNPNYGRPSKSALPVEIRVDNFGHVIVEDKNKARRRCRQCKSTTIYKCVKCQVHLHANCFEKFHTK
ncbi:piggyBac transposable element-derived protein 3-like [Myzus persicae]|uniref:piggyBac transposable element-derived protein 3-like n=1 Tax=Myzus persicae TaxID=13164 RepID=UPI000B936E68|nr:piggyBac transposable element-derived protein 3-like [Myzus persicae]